MLTAEGLCDTQEGLYMALHNSKTSGKTGLGKGKGSGASHNPICCSRLRPASSSLHPRKPVLSRLC